MPGRSGDSAARRRRPGRGCIWCGEDATTDEDVIAQWIARLFNERYWHLSPNFAIRGAGWWHDLDNPREPPAKRVRVLLRVCSPCNNEWMSRLETQVAPLLSRLIFGEQLTVDDADANVLSAWSFKTLVNATFDAHRRASQLVSAGSQDYLRNHLVPPPDVSLTAYYIEGLDTKVRTSVKDVPVRGPGGRLRDTALVATLLIGRIAVQMVMHHSGSPPRPAFPSAVQAAAVTLWPPDSRSGSDFSWPPSGAVVGEKEFELLADPDDDAIRSWLQ